MYAALGALEGRFARIRLVSCYRQPAKKAAAVRQKIERRDQRRSPGTTGKHHTASKSGGRSANGRSRGTGEDVQRPSASAANQVPPSREAGQGFGSPQAHGLRTRSPHRTGDSQRGQRVWQANPAGWNRTRRRCPVSEISDALTRRRACLARRSH